MIRSELREGGYGHATRRHWNVRLILVWQIARRHGVSNASCWMRLHARVITRSPGVINRHAIVHAIEKSVLTGGGIFRSCTGGSVNGVFCTLRWRTSSPRYQVCAKTHRTLRLNGLIPRSSRNHTLASLRAPHRTRLLARVATYDVQSPQTQQR